MRPPRFRSRLGTLLSMILFAAVVAAFVGAAPGGCGPVQPGADPVVVSGERSLQAAVASVDAFLTFEYDNRALVAAKYPAIHAAAEQLRRDVQDPVRDPIRLAQAAVRTYKATRAPADGDKLDAALSRVEALSRAARSYLLTLQNR